MNAQKHRRLFTTLVSLRKRATKKGRRVIAAASILALLMGMQVTAVGAETQTYSLPDNAHLSVGGVSIVRKGQLTGETPENVSYNPQTNVLTLDNYVSNPDADSGVGISFYYMGDDFTIHLEGENSITAPSRYFELISGDYLNFEGSGTLNLLNVTGIGINYRNGLTIDGCTININGSQSDTITFYGINGNYTWETEALIKNAKINISNTKPSKSKAANAGIDVQGGNLTIQNSDISINLTNGRIFGLAVGYTRNDDTLLGGKLTIEDSTIRCITTSDSTSDYYNYNHNMYFYNMTNADQLHYYTSTDNSFVEKSFDETFERDKYIKGRYDSGVSTVISSSPLAEYCSHEWDEGVVTTKPSCENPGETTYTCALCEKTRTEKIPALGHNWSDWQVIKEAACTEDGTSIRTCSRCNKTESMAIPQLGHDFVTEVVKEPTCTEPGLQKKTCSRCDLVIENETIPATGHNYEWTVEKEASFHEDGVKTGTCANCGDVITERIPKLSESHEHDFSGREEIVQSATCTEEGIKYIYCTEPECGEYITETIPMAAHTPGEWTTVKQATCSENGLEERICTVCGEVVETRITDTIEHTYNEWTVTVEPGCTEAGVESAVCTVCGETAVRGIDALGHDYAHWDVTKEATCTEDGEETSVCTRCGETETRAVEATGHSFGEWKVVKEATQTEDGERQAVCSVCGEVKSEIIPKLSDSQSTVPNENTGTNDNTTNQVAPTDPTTPTKSVTTTTTSTTQSTGKEASGKVATGDSGSIVIMLAVLAVSSSAIIIFRRKKREE